MENLDEFMRHKMQTDTPGEPFPFREEHWEHALKLLEAEDRRKKRRRAIFWWWLFGLLLLPSAGALAWWLTQRTPKAPSREAIAMEPAANQATAAENAVSDTKGASDSTSERHLLNTAKNAAAETPTQKGVAKTTAGTTNISAPIKAKPSNNISKSGSPNPPEGLTSQTLKPENTSISLENTQTLKPENTSIPPENTQTLKPENTSLTLLAQAATTIRHDRTLKTQAVQVPPAPIKPVQTARWHVGALIEGAVQPTATGPRHLGYAGGLNTRYRLSDKWQLGAGIAMRQMAVNLKNETAAPATTQNKYSFGYTSESQKDSSLNHFALEMPLTVQRRFGRLGVEAGIAPGVLLGLGATRIKTQKSSLAPDPKTSETKVWLGKNTAYKNFWIAPVLALDYRLNKRLSVNLNAQYRPGGLLLRDIEFYDNAGTDLSIGLGLRLNLFNIK